MPSLVVDQVTKHYGAFRAIEDVSFAVERGEFIVMVGPSGCGKSTLLRIIAGLEPITAGRIVIGDRDVTHLEPADRGVAMVFQNYALYPHMNVAQNMGFGLKMSGRPRAEVEAAVRRAAEILRITEHLHKRPKELSGGQKQRVAIGRAITRAPDVFLFDEPLSNLDAALRSQMRVELSPPPLRAPGDDDLRHPRPDRSHDHGEPDRGHQCRRASSRSVRRSNSTTVPATSSSLASSARRA